MPWNHQTYGKSMENPWFSQEMIHKCCGCPCLSLFQAAGSNVWGADQSNLWKSKMSSELSPKTRNAKFHLQNILKYSMSFEKTPRIQEHRKSKLLLRNNSDRCDKCSSVACSILDGGSLLFTKSISSSVWCHVTKHTGLGNGELGNAITTHRRESLEKVSMLGDLLLGTYQIYKIQNGLHPWLKLTTPVPSEQVLCPTALFTHRFFRWPS